MNKTFVSLVVVVLLIVAGMSLYILRAQEGPMPIACTAEAKLCPDGSAVGRTGPACEFAPCPSEAVSGDTATSTSSTTPELGTGILNATMTIGPVCPVEREGMPCDPTPEMFAARKVSVYRSNHTTLVTTLTPNASGTMSAALPVGDYWVDMPHPGIGGVAGLPVTIHIAAGSSTTLTIDVDTGIR